MTQTIDLTVTGEQPIHCLRGHGRPSALILTALSGVLMYLSIYVWMSDVLYVLSFISLVGAGLLGLNLTRRHPQVAARATGTA